MATTTSVQVLQAAPSHVVVSSPPHTVVPLQQPPQYWKTVRGLAITQLVIGMLTALLGGASIASLQFLDVATCIGTGMWAGGWIAVTGGLGVFHARNHNLNGVYLTFSIISSIATALAGLFLTISVVFYADTDCELETFLDLDSHRCELKNVGLVLQVPSLILMIVEFFVSIVAAVYCCNNNGCCGGTEGVVLHQHPYQTLVEECGDGSTRVVASAGSTVITSTSGYPNNNAQYPPQYGGYMPPQYVGPTAPQYGGQAAPQYGGQAAPQYGGQAAAQHSIQMQTPVGYGEQASGAATFKTI